MFGGGFPFGDFEGMGGGGGFPGGGMRGPPKPKADTQKFYDLLGVDKQATFDQIKKAFRKKAIKEHPDKGGDLTKWQEITAAYDVLGDKEKRELYDQGGEEAVQQGRAMGGGGHGDIFSQMFGGGGGRPKGPQKGKSVQHAIKVTLEEIYKGKTSKIAVNRDRICQTCMGKGGKDGSEATCSKCRGRGMVTQMTQLGPGMYSQQTVPCPDCGGSGSSIRDEDKCPDCAGKKVKKEKKVIECVIDKGAPHGEKYVFHGESDEHPEKEPGDVIIAVNEQPHKLFKRKGADLFMEKTISLREALTGVDFSVKYLDGENLRIKSTPGTVIKPDSLMTIEEKGLPFHKNPYKFGNLFIMFHVKFPDTLNDTQLGQIGDVLSGMKKKSVDANMDVAETCILQPYSAEQKNTHAQGGTRGNDSDEEEDDPRMGGGQKVQCAQQ